MFVAKREALENTWVNHYGAFVDAYAVDDASTLTQAEVGLADVSAGA